MPATVIVSDRFSVSDRTTVAIASTVLQDLGLITKKDSSLFCDRQKQDKRRKTEGPRGCTRHSPGYRL